MACGWLHPVPAGAATVAALWPCFLSPVRQSFTKEATVLLFPMSEFSTSASDEQLNQFQRWKLPLNAAKSQRESWNLADRSSSGSSEGVAAASRPADAPTAQSALPMTRSVDAVPGAPIVISGYWTGPGVDDGCGSVEAVLQRIA
ncbi:uncharacterized protein [Zea mays]|uniref:Uncharacterized protein n=1 Tax=Zea mays TaxID=4577 RepID=A0A804QI97_MAIZE|nr:uncharacterized protein LOC103633545 isoform X1 [Zea mays]|eukprot:XP_020396897.1 uncharacterized protein LOC103633545 isoform X1 [Zea mays]